MLEREREIYSLGNDIIYQVSSVDHVLFSLTSSGRAQNKIHCKDSILFSRISCQHVQNHDANNKWMKMNSAKKNSSYHTKDESKPSEGGRHFGASIYGRNTSFITQGRVITFPHDRKRVKGGRERRRRGPCPLPTGS